MILNRFHYYNYCSIKKHLTTFSTRAIILLSMSDGLSARQTQILKALIDEYIETAVPVGSENLDKNIIWEYPRQPSETKWLL